MSNSVKINYSKLNGVLNKTIELKTKNMAAYIAETQLQNAKERLIEEIKTDPVSIEIEQGPELARSKFIKGRGSRKYGGNLFSFLGFFAGSKPIDDLIDIIEKNYKILYSSVRLKNGQYNIIVKGPSLQDIKDATPLPWTSGKSWITAIEKGLSNVINYIRVLGKGRSTGGIQVKAEIDKTLKNKPDFFTAKFKRFLQNIYKQPNDKSISSYFK